MAVSLTSSDHILERLKELLVKYIGKKTDVDASTCLHHDLHLSGDDVSDFFEEIHGEFKIDFSRIQFDRYFVNEVKALGDYFLSFFGFSSKKKKLSIGHLVKVIELGYWFDPI